jgi:ABC-2 type transport system permease protein
MGGIALHRIWAVFIKELIQMRRDRMTAGMILGIPVMQLVLFGFAINSDPKHLPAVLVVQDHSAPARSFVAAMENTRYFDIISVAGSEAAAKTLMTQGKAAFIVTIPPGFSRALMRGDRPQILVQADASDPSAAANAVAALAQLPQSALVRELTGPAASLQPQPPPFEVVVHRLYNPEGIAAFNIVPGLIGVILTMTMVLVTGMAVVKEFERGTMENLLALPPKPFEVMAGKIMPYILLGYVQVVVVFIAARVLFGVPMTGSYFELSAILLLFIAANLSVGFTLSALAQNQAQAMQMTMFYFLPSILLSGFMFPFRGMPIWAQWIGEALPITHFLRIVRGIMLKGNPLAEMWNDVWPILLFTVVMWAVALVRYRRTLD